MSLLAAGLMPAAPASAATPIASGFGSATGVELGVTLLSGLLPINVGIPPTPQVSFGPTSTGTSTATSLLTVTTEPTLNLLATKVLSVRSGTLPATGSPITDSQSSAEVDGLQVLISAVPLVSADVVKSTCDFNATTATGTTSVVNLSIAGHTIINGAVPPNTVIPILIGDIILNEQKTTNTPNGPEITVNAIHIVLNSIIATGNIIVSQSVCGGTRGPVTGTLQGSIFTCNGSQPGPLASGGSFSATGPQTVNGPNPLSQTVPAGNYQLTGTAPTGDEFVTSCSNQTPVGTTETQPVTVPSGGTNTGGNFYVIPIPPANSANVFVGYADNWNSSNAFFPNPWQGSPNTMFVGSAELTTPGAACTNNDCWDTGVIRVDNTSSATETVSVNVTIGSFTYPDSMWGTQNLPAGQTLVLAQTSSNGSYNFDTSDTQTGCTPSGQIPTVTVTVNGQSTTYHDNTQVLDTGGIDRSMCPAGTDEGQAYAQLTS